MTASPRPFVFQIVGYKNSGKTTLVTALVRHMKAAGYIVGTIKHDAHDFSIDTPGTDTWKHQEAGADLTAISSSRRSAVLINKPEPLSSLLEHMQHADMVIVEGFKQAHYPKLVLLRDEDDLELLNSVTHISGVVAAPGAVHLLPTLASRYPSYTRDDLAGIVSCLETLKGQASSIEH